ncbi:MAG: response regulator [Deltaproteobacteria bacterium]|nr:response regulator [Deltaproteobacteria bacterium]
MKRILLVDDVKLFLSMEKTFLTRQNLQIFTASSGPEAIDIHKREKVDLILCDLYMPGMNGDEVCRIIRTDNNLKKVSIIIVTSSAKDADMCLASGANDYITKPINATELLKKIGKYLNIPLRCDIRILAKIGVERMTKGVASESFLGNTVNISRGGILIETSHGLNVEEIVFCSFVIPGNSTPINASGKVVRMLNDSQHGANRLGIKFLDMKEEDKWTIDSYVKRHPEATV